MGKFLHQILTYRMELTRVGSLHEHGPLKTRRRPKILRFQTSS